MGGEDPALVDAFRDIRELKVDAALPFLLKIYDDYKSSVITMDELLHVLRLLESYVFRRAILNIPTNSHSRTFALLGVGLNKAHYVNQIAARFMELPSYRRFPNDEEFGQILQIRDLYNIRIRSYWLRRIENFNRRERVAMEEYTIEHIMPQTDKLDPQWLRDLGNDWKFVQATYLHTLGNLTLTRYNSQYGARPFVEKRDLPEVGFASSPLNLNQGLGTLDRWDLAAIQHRAARLTRRALEVWPLPVVDATKLDRVPGKAQEWSRESHPKLISGPSVAIYEALRARIMAHNAVITEEFRARYAVYLAESIFLSLIPLARSLRLVLNMPFSQVRDTRKLCRDVSEVGHWGIGDVEVEVEADTDLDYIMALIGQAFDAQLGVIEETA